MIIKEKFSINNEQIQRMESNAVQLLKDLQQLKYMNKNEKVVAEEEYDDVVSESDIEEEEEHEHENEIEGFVEMCTSNCSSV